MESLTPVLNDEGIDINRRIRSDRDTTLISENWYWTNLLTFRRYANGHHSIILTEKQRLILNNLIGVQFCDNICHQIIHEANGRLVFQKYQCINAEVKNWVDEFFAHVRIKARQSTIHYNTLRDGNYVVAVDWDSEDDNVQIYKESWWDGISGVYIHYDETDKADYAVKEWQERDEAGAITYRRTIWYKNRLERWVSDNNVSGWKHFLLPEDDGVWPLPKVDKQGNPLGIPYIHFLNTQRTYDNYGVSELDGGVIGFQDQLVSAQFALTATSNLTGYQMYYATGVKPRKRTGTEELLPVVVEPGAFHQTENDKAKFGHLPAGDISQQINAYNMKLKRVAQMTSTPVHIITGGDWPSGEALLRAEFPAVNKANNQLNTLQSCWVQVAVMALKIWNLHKPQKAINYDIKAGIIEAVFSDPERRDAVSRSIIVHNMGANVSRAEALRIMEYPEEQAQQVVTEINQDAMDNAKATLAAIPPKPVVTSSVPKTRTKKTKQATGSPTSNRTSGE